MPSAPQCRVAIAGASTLLGKEVSRVLEERGFPFTDVRLLDDEVADGTLAASGGEPVVIQGVDEDSFEYVRFAFFTGSTDFTARHWRQAARAGSTVIDLGGPLSAESSAVPWIPALRKKLAPPRPVAGKLYYSPPSASLIACTLAAALQETPLRRLAITFYQPVSERGQPGIEELESQTVSLLSMKPFSREVYGAQVAFNLLGNYESGRNGRLSDVCEAISRDVARYLNGRVPVPAIDMVQVPVFYGYAFSACVEFSDSCDSTRLGAALESVGVPVASSVADSPDNISVAGESQIFLAQLRRDSNFETICWLWGAADNVRLAAANAVSIAETLLAS